MQYVAFEVNNYRGIDYAKIELPTGAGARVTTLIGLNESGKTTLLEAIYSFSPDPESKALYGDAGLLSDDPAYYIPRGEFSNFNGNISVTAEVRWDHDELEAVKRRLSYRGIQWDTNDFASTFIIESRREYKASNLISKNNYWHLTFSVKSGRQQYFREATADQRRVIFSELLPLLPSIAYFPTFVFNFPHKIYLQGGPDKALDKFYRKIFQAILDEGGEGHSTEDHIVKRYKDLHNDSLSSKIIDASAVFMGARSAQEMIKQTVDKAADTVSDAIMTKWDEIFPHSPLRKEISVDSFEEYERKADANGIPIVEHDVWVEFKVRDSGARYNISDRSLGFRWFFCFLLFTKFMARNEGNKGILFLFDEPASNLHARAQEKLLESFSDISRDPNNLIFSTHSHYMIEPTWLERAYVVKNDAIDYSDAGGERKGKKVKIEAVRYREFVSQSDEKLDRSTYFQPVLDRLDVKPSKLDLQSRCVVVEGKSDFHVLTYIKQNYLKNSIAVVPAFGATTMRPVIGILRGWASKFLILLDGDAEGSRAARAYKEELDLEREIILLSEIDAEVQEIEDFFSEDDLSRLQKHFRLEKTPKKKQLSRIFQEANAAGAKLPLSLPTINRLKKVLRELSSRVAA